MNYREAVAWLDSLADWERRGDWRYDTKHFSLDRVRALLDALGNPQARYPLVVVAGTKGKGSTAAMLTAILTAAGHRTGLYTSPHLIEYPERIRIGLEPVPRGEFAALAEAVVPHAARLASGGEDRRPTTFEALTAMALLGFSRRRVAVAVLEVGMGGRFDAVNAVDASVVCVTPVSLDHTDQLGGTVPEIAAEKAGVIRSAAPVVSTAAHLAGALPVIEAACRKAGAPLTVADPAAVRGLTVALAGTHQAVNAAIAVEAARRVPLPVSEEAIREGLATVRWPGRLESVACDPEVLVDGAHNAHSAEALAEAVRTLWRPARLRLVFAMLTGKPHAEVARSLVPLAERVWCPALKHPRALPPGELAAHVAAAGGTAEVVAGTPEALAAARRDFRGPGTLVLAAGSLALVGEVMLSCSAPCPP